MTATPRFYKHILQQVLCRARIIYPFQYQAKYSGTVVRRHAKLKGTQTWSEGGKTMTRACSGAIKRPLKPFLPRKKPAAA